MGLSYTVVTMHGTAVPSLWPAAGLLCHNNATTVITNTYVLISLTQGGELIEFVEVIVLL